MNAKPIAPPALIRHLELLSLYYSEMGLDPPVAMNLSLRDMTREERLELAAFLKRVMAEPPAKPKSNRIHFENLGRLALYRDGLPEFLDTLDAFNNADRAAKKAEPAINRRHRKPR